MTDVEKTLDDLKLLNALCYGTVLDDAIALLTGQPQIVRCKDCKYGGCRTTNTDGSLFRVVCKLNSTKRNEIWKDADWFCADGVKRE